jgi:DNA mismatch repair protein MutL
VAGEEAARIEAEGGRVGPVRPRPLSRGTVVEVRDLFFATPARLKFLRGERAEAHGGGPTWCAGSPWPSPSWAFTLRDLSEGERLVLRLTPRRRTCGPARGAAAEAARRAGAGLLGGAVPLEAEREGHHLTGWAGLPAEARGRPRRSTCSSTGGPCGTSCSWGALRAGYMDVLASGRHPMAALFLDCDPQARGRERASRQGRGALPRSRTSCAGWWWGAAAGAGGLCSPRRRWRRALEVAPAGGLAMRDRAAARPSAVAVQAALPAQAPGFAEALAARRALGRRRGPSPGASAGRRAGAAPWQLDRGGDR